MNKRIFYAVLGFALAASPVCFAAVKVDEGFSGTVMVTDKEGNVSMVDQGEKVPVIGDQSELQVFNGGMHVSTDKDDSVKVSCNGQNVEVGGGASVSLTCGQDDGKLKVDQGSITLLMADGTRKIVNAGEEFAVGAAKKAGAVPPTAAGNEGGGPAVGGDLSDPPPVDSRSIQNSPSQ